MKAGASKTLVSSLLLLGFTWSSVGQAAAAPGAKSRLHQVHFRDDDFQAQRTARKLLGKEDAQEEDMPSGSYSFRTAWVKVSRGDSPDLFVMYGCSPTGNCGLYGFEPAKRGWRLVLNSDAQMCSMLPSSHDGRRDISAYMHGSATDGTIKTYWWRNNRYVQVSERDVIFH
jgi:hypothetical protein